MYKTNHWFEHHDHFPEYICVDCEEKKPKIEEAKEYLEHLISLLYGDSELEPLEVDEDISEICHRLQVEIPQGRPKIYREKKQLIIQNEKTLQKERQS